MKVPFFLAEHGYQPDPENPLRFVNPDGHPWHPVTFTDDRQKNHGECIRGMLEAMRAATVEKCLAEFSSANAPAAKTRREIEEQRTKLGIAWEIKHGYRPAPDPQCDGCRWSWAAGAPPNDGAACVGYCYFHEHRVENCPDQEIKHPKKTDALKS